MFFGEGTSHVVDAFGMKSGNQVPGMLTDVIRKRGAPKRILSDSAANETSSRIKGILCAVCIDDWQSEANDQFQQPSERRYQTAKRLANTVMDRLGVLALAGSSTLPMSASS